MILMPLRDTMSGKHTEIRTNRKHTAGRLCDARLNHSSLCTTSRRVLSVKLRTAHAKSKNARTAQMET